LLYIEGNVDGDTCVDRSTDRGPIELLMVAGDPLCRETSELDESALVKGTRLLSALIELLMVPTDFEEPFEGGMSPEVAAPEISTVERVGRVLLAAEIVFNHSGDLFDMVTVSEKLSKDNCTLDILLPGLGEVRVFGKLDCAERAWVVAGVLDATAILIRVPDSAVAVIVCSFDTAGIIVDGELDCDGLPLGPIFLVRSRRPSQPSDEKSFATG
jgi:phenylpyruvate tautomerase PptA (4-oxalocrotonate tautomerase family)